VIAYLDMPSGISGDMFLGCLIDAGWSIDALRQTIGRLGLPDGSWSVEARATMRGPLHATFADVHTEEPAARHRHLRTIRALIESAELPSEVKGGAIGTFERLAAAEAKVHGTSVEEVHFHEVGALDAIVDIVGVTAGLHAMGIDALFASAAPLGPGWVDTEHGRLPLPAPATLELLAAAGAPTCGAPGPGELVTPTGAALLAQLATFEQPRMRLAKIAVGCGRTSFDWPNVARLWLGEPADTSDPIVQLDANIDDMNPQFYASVSDRLFEAGALDVWNTPVQMKKGRPGVVLSVLAPRTHEAALAQLVLRETTTFGLRTREVQRYEASREFRVVETAFGEVRVKIKRLGGDVVGAMPEFEDCRRLAEEHGVTVRAVHEAALAAGRSQGGGEDAPP
jgi:uncharacterized protein (TIGR00299 family) protein